MAPALGVACAYLAAGCAGMIAGSPAWFERQKPDVQELAAADLQCADKPIEYKPVSGDDYREVEAKGCGKKVSYKMIKIGPVSKWSKATDVSQL